jgi:hypothetical protein
MPELVGEPVDRNRARSIYEQKRKQDALTRPPEPNRVPIPNHLDGSEHPKLDHPRAGSRLAGIVIGRW